MGGYWGDETWNYAYPPDFTYYHKTSDFASVGASILFLLIDDGYKFECVMRGWPDKPQDYWLPNSTIPFSHNGSASLTFADGHSEAHRWKDSRTTPAVWPYATPSPNNVDIGWLQWHSTRAK